MTTNTLLGKMLTVYKLIDHSLGCLGCPIYFITVRCDTGYSPGPFISSLTGSSPEQEQRSVENSSCFELSAKLKLSSNHLISPPGSCSLQILVTNCRKPPFQELGQTDKQLPPLSSICSIWIL